MNLKTQLEGLIHLNGSMPLDQFLGIAIHHYYSNTHPFGNQGDFITAPEISQMFGEIIGVWCVNTWLNNNSPVINLVEIGGGNGTLMEDMLRGTKHIQGFHEKVEKIYMVETSDKLIATQKGKLAQYSKIEWVHNLDKVEPKFTIIINNEFFDALPIKQFIKTETGFSELHIIWHNHKFVLVPIKVEVNLNIDCKMGDIIEFSPQRESYARKMTEVIKSNGGALLIIDYGFFIPPYKSTLQSVKANKKQDYFFDNLGEADITSLVDFAALINVFHQQGFSYNFFSQGDFLKNHGIELRAEQLIKNNGNREAIYSQLKRLISSEEMGELFKVLEVYS